MSIMPRCGPSDSTTYTSSWLARMAQDSPSRPSRCLGEGRMPALMVGAQPVPERGRARVGCRSSIIAESCRPDSGRTSGPHIARSGVGSSLLADPALAGETRLGVDPGRERLGCCVHPKVRAGVARLVASGSESSDGSEGPLTCHRCPRAVPDFVPDQSPFVPDSRVLMARVDT